MFDLSGKTALVTGASGGIGGAIARALKAQGAKVAVSGTNAEKLAALGEGFIAITANLADKADVERLAKEAEEKLGGAVDILVNNAGIFKFEPLEAVKEEEFHREFNTNVLGPILAIQEGVKHFGPNGGSVINISSVASQLSPPNSVVYSATKGALDSVTRVLAKELGALNIRVNTLAPGGVETEGTHTAGIIGSDFEREMVAKTPLGRLGQPDDIARVAVFLASSDSNWLTGERIAAAGGMQ